VDLQLTFGYHGVAEMAFLPDGSLNQQLIVHGVTADDYARTAAFSDRLVAGRDIFAHEGVDEPPLNNMFFARRMQAEGTLPRMGAYTATELMSKFSRGSEHNPNLAAEDHTALYAAAQQLPDPASPEGRQLAATWERLAMHRALDPLFSAAGRAAMRGVQLWKADASLEQLIDFQDRWFRWWYPPDSERGKLRFVRGPEHRFRNNRTLEQLGAAALTLDTSGPERPILAYAGGAAHKKDIEAKLTRHGIPFTSELFSPDWRTRDKALAKQWQAKA
jgi:hypothetical protein